MGKVVFITSNFLKFHTEKELIKGEAYFKNDFDVNLKKHWNKDSNVLFVAADPDDYDETDFRAQELYDVLSGHNFKIKRMRIADHREKTEAAKLVKWADVIILLGGYAPVQLDYFTQMNLGEALRSFEGILIGISAGSVNMADEVYMMPEREGEVLDPVFIRFRQGLGITPLNIIPHSEYLNNLVLDGKKYIDEIAVPDSYGRRFYLIPDGSYFIIENGYTRFYGEGELISDGKKTPLKEGQMLPYSSCLDAGRLSSFLNNGCDFVFTVDLKNGDCIFYYMCERAGRVVKSSRYDEIMNSVATIIDEDEKEVFLRDLLLKNVQAEVNERMCFVRTIHLDTDIGRLAKNIRINPIAGRPDELLCTFIDITTIIDHDWMTDEYSRSGFLNVAKKILADYPEDEEISLIYTNIKGFKAINELFGEQSGDMVIFQTREALRKRLKPLVMGRLEGDHFILIVKNEVLKERTLRELCRQTYIYEYKEYHYDIRCGIYPIKDRTVAVNHMIDRAKMTEKSVRSDMGSRYAYYTDDFGEKYVRAQILLSDMRDALHAGEFVPYYQPIVDAMTGEIVSAEALIRWNHHLMGMVSPGDFIPAIESAGKISRLDRFMFDRIYQMTQDRAGNKKKIVPCAVNLSRIDFYDPGFMESIFKGAANAGKNAELMRIEVTESAYADLEKSAVDYLSEMKNAGLKILLDDFGSGMSSLSTLENFSFDIVKLDMGFIRKIGTKKSVEMIIESTINLSHALGAKVTAEGVETKKQFEFLRNAGCDYIQGYYFYKPLPESEFVKILDGEGAA